ncbi:unnamed protein product [Cunninghamella blakesleeana]
MSVPARSPSNVPGQSSQNIITELQERAVVNRSDINKYALRKWITSVNRLYEEGDSELEHGNLENSFVYFMKGCNIMLEVMKHSEYSTIQKDPFYLKLIKRTDTDVLEKLEDIRKTLQNDYDQQVPKHIDDNVIDIQKEMNKYPAISSLSILDDLPPVPSHLPSTFDNKKTSIGNPVLQQSNSEINTQDSMISSPSHKYINTNSYDKNILSKSSASTPPRSSVSANTTSLQLPHLTNNIYPQTLEVEPWELVQWITQKDNPRSVLLLDVRPRDMFLQACIKHKWMVQIEPLVLRKDVTSQKIQDSLVPNPEVEQQLFENRHQFDIIVLYDQNSSSINQLNEPLHYLKTAIYELEFQKALPRMPMILVGGFDAWINTVGNRGTYSFTDPSRNENRSNSSQKPQLKQHGYSINTSKQSYPRSRDEKTEVPSVNHTLYDYFNQKHRGGQLQSMSQTAQYEMHDSIMQHKPYYGHLSQQHPLIPASSHENNIRMPIPLPSGHPLPINVDYNNNNYSNALNHSRYPDIQPNASNMETGLIRRKTFIDNPFHGFTSTSNKLYDTPPVIPAKPTRNLPPPPLPQHNIPNNTNNINSVMKPQLPPKLPVKINNRNNNPHTTPQNNTRIAPVSDSSFSQLGSVLIGTTGLKNLGNTCYMNSIIQCLSGTIPFARYFISGMYKQHVNKQNPLGTGGILADSFAELLRVMWSENYNFISPVTFREALVRFAPHYSGTEQQDSQEFLNFLLDGLHEDLNTVQKKPKNNDQDDDAFEKLPDYQASGIAWEKYLARNASVIVSLFQGQYRSRLICLSCKTTSTTYNTFMSLSLPIPSKSKLSVGSSGVTLYQCLDHFVKEEILEKSDAWHCPKCKKLRKASKSLSLSKLPDVLLIHLKRFSFDGPFRNKLETNVDYPTKNLDLSRYVPKSMVAPNKPTPILNYDLYAVSNHFGTLTGGHYTACVRNGYRGEWHNFDDTRFSVCDEAKVKSRAAYNLFYVRSTIK